MPSVYIETYGCSLNHADTALAKTVLAKRGYTFTDNPEDADVIIVNTCTVRMDSEERMKKVIRRLREIALKNNARLIVAGCMAAAQPFTVKRVAPEAVLVSPSNMHLIWRAVEEGVDLLREPEEAKTRVMPEPKYAMRGKIAEVPLVDGCLGNCSFCITRVARRHVYSRPPKLVLEYVRKLVSHGVVEIRLTGQDTAVYGIDIAGKRLLPDLVRDIVELDGDFMVRIGMMSPDQLQPILDEIVDVLKHPKVYKFLHIPVQSGDDRVLKIMGRRYTVDDVREIVKYVRSRIPGITIATDIIVGHPGEDEEAFENTLKLLEELRFERVHLAQYTPRPRTIAAAMPQVPDPVKKERSKKAMAVIERIGFEEHSRLVGSRARVLVVGPAERGGLEGRLYNYVQVILHEKVEPGWHEVEIVEATWYDVRGKII
ncbi:MAG TPA: tRNA (N(6)-L-threonylcarbamoyladenosine(37)-C(2))-methylthiotransferase [Pyrodictium sp.]|nr:tRNA (N(6)-L-threonylcarbamoyladenosine(37)-C(2))-methylthiotransferase [Pyrodictium sp.]